MRLRMWSKHGSGTCAPDALRGRRRPYLRSPGPDGCVYPGSTTVEPRWKVPLMPFFLSCKTRRVVGVACALRVRGTRQPVPVEATVCAGMMSQFT
jgi:hypothetical protein